MQQALIENRVEHAAETLAQTIFLIQLLRSGNREQTNLLTGLSDRLDDVRVLIQDLYSGYASYASENTESFEQLPCQDKAQLL